MIYANARLTQLCQKLGWECRRTNLMTLGVLLWTSLTIPVSAKQLVLMPQNLSADSFTLSTPDLSVSEGDSEIAQLFYPNASDRQSIQVIGIGQASQSADRAILELIFSPQIEEVPFDATSSESDWEEVEPLTTEELQSVVNALTAKGIPESAITAKIAPPSQGSSYFPFPGAYNPGGATIMIRFNQPRSEDLDKVMGVVQGVVEDSERLSLQTANVQLELDNCLSLEQQAYEAAVGNGQLRAKSIANLLNATLDIPAISEAFYNPILPGCNLENFSWLSSETRAYEPEMETTISVIRQLFFTYPILSSPR